VPPSLRISIRLQIALQTLWRSQNKALICRYEEQYTSQSREE
jgi:hypothetical protein